MIGCGLLAAGALLALTSCGSTTTKTVTKSASAPSPAPVSSTTTQPATSTATATAAAAMATGSVYFDSVVGGRQQRPASLQLTGDGTLFVSGVQWRSWGGATATGSGNAQYHGCNPNCAEAPAHTALVSIRLSNIRACSGRRYYSSVELTLNSGQLLDKQYLQRSWSPC